MKHFRNLIAQGRTRRFVLLAGALATLAVVTAMPAGATTPATFTLTGGALSISAPTTSVSLGSQVAASGSSTISGQLGTVTVSDQRGGPTTWIASAISTSFVQTPDNAGPADPASNVSYAAGAITFTGTAAGAAVAAPNLTGVSPVVNGSTAGIGTASWNPTISVVIPPNFAPGVYDATITNSVA
jgi:hypothetical protein